jgi:hypothetical protein
MRLMKLEDWSALVYAPGSAPHPVTLRRRIQRGKLQGGMRDEHGFYYVDMDKSEAADPILRKRDDTRANPLLKGLL